MTPRSRATSASALRGAAGGRDVDALKRMMGHAPLFDAVKDLRRDVENTRLPLLLDDVERAEGLRRQLLDQLDDQLLPRLRELSAPAVVVVAGSTGAGKSTVVNSLVREEVSAAGVLRPTTHRPVLVHNPADGELLTDQPLLKIVTIVQHEAIPRGLAIIDAPDLDSLLESNRSTAKRLLEAADLWVFLTTAARYGDALPWDVLGTAVERGTSMAMVLNRVPRKAVKTIRSDLMERLSERGLADVPLFLIPDFGPHEGLLEPATIAPLRRWLSMVAGADRARSVILRTQRGTLRALQPWVAELAECVQAQADARAELQRVVSDAVTRPADQAAASATGGAMVAGSVRARWASSSGRSGPLSGRWTALHGRPSRARALRQLAADLRGTVAIALAGARRNGECSLDEALEATNAPGAATLRAAVQAATDRSSAEAPTPAPAATGPAASEDEPGKPTSVPTPEESASDWMRGAVTRVREVAGSDDRAVVRSVGRLLRVVEEEDAGVLVALAATGLGAAAVALTSLVGSQTCEAILVPVRADIADRAAHQARAAVGPALAFLDSPDLADDAASVLRLRLAVLKGFK